MSVGKMLNDYEHGIVTEDEYSKYIYAGHQWLGVAIPKNGVLQNFSDTSVFNKSTCKWE